MSRRPAKRRKPGTIVKTGDASSRHVLSTLGTAVEIIYRHANGKLMSHKFNKGVRLGFTAKSNALVISPVQVNPFIEG